MRSWHVAQIGGRQRYGVARVLADRGLLGSFSTDIWTGPVISKLERFGLPRRFHRELLGCPVHAQSFRALFRGLVREREHDLPQRFWVSAGREFGRWAASNAVKAGLGEGDFTHGFTGENLELSTEARRRGAVAVHGQVDPGPSWFRMRSEEAERWLGASSTVAPIDPLYQDRMAAEWAAADMIIVNSRHCFSALVAEGVDPARLRIVPLGIETIRKAEAKRAPDFNEKFRVLFVGRTDLAKGFAYFGEAAKLAGPDFEFVAIGNIALPPRFLSDRAWPIRYTGHLRNSALTKEFSHAHALVFPTLSDGFGMVQLEAMAFGLPVIATTACGDVVQDGKSGFTVPLRNAEIIVSRLRQMRDDDTLYRHLSENALLRVREFTYDQFGNRLIAAATSHQGASP